MDHQSMQQVHEDAIRKNRVNIIREMNPEGITQRLRELNMLSDTQCEVIQTKPTRIEKNGAILDIVIRSGALGFKQFCQSLTASGSHHLRLLLDPEAAMWELSERTVLLLIEDGLKIQRESHFRSVNISYKAWQQLKKAIPNIQEAVNNQADEEVKFPLHSGQYAVVCKYHENMYVGFHRVENGFYVKGFGINLNMMEWTAFLQVMDTIHEELVSSKSLEATPDTYQLIDIVYRYLLERMLGYIMEERCEGCKIDAPGQQAHMEDGCLSEWSEVVDNYLDLAKERVNRALVAEVTTRLFQKLCQPMDPFFLPMLDIYLYSHTICPQDMLQRDIGEFYKEKLCKIMEQL